MKTDVLITGGGGMLAYALKRELASRGYTIAAPTKAELDVTDETAVHDVVRKLTPRIIIQCAAYTRVDDAESHEDEAYRVNALGTKFAAEAAREVGARFVYPSTDYVFDGTAATPYMWHADPNPINAYGRTKLAGELSASRAPDHLIVRLSWLYGLGGRNFVRRIAKRLDAGHAIQVVSDQVGRPSWTVDAARALTDLLANVNTAGIYHWGNAGFASWFDVADQLARIKRCNGQVVSCSTRQYPRRALRPAYSVLDCEQTECLLGRARDWRDALSAAVESRAF